MTRSLYAQLALALALILLLLGTALGWLGYAAAKHHQHDIVQQLSQALARHIGERVPLIDREGVDEQGLAQLFDALSTVNPNIELYLLDARGRILRQAPYAEPLERQRVSLGPIQAFVDGEALPILGDNPRNPGRGEVFSVAPIEVDGVVAGYVYIILLSQMYRDMVEAAWSDYVLRGVGWIALAALALALLAGLASFAWLTRRLRRLAQDMRAFQNPGSAAPPARGDEIAQLGAEFARLRERLQQQVAELENQDRLRRELVANVSHDLRTPLTSMQNYLETLQRMDRQLSPDEQRQYLDVAVRQSQRVARLAGQLFELARLECEEAAPHTEPFSLAELIQDIVQKFALGAEEQGLKLVAAVDPGIEFVQGDIGMIERVISNLVENAIRHTPSGGEIRLQATVDAQGIEVQVVDSGSGIASEHLQGLFERGSALRLQANRRGGGLGLLIAHRILALHGSAISAESRVGEGTAFRFVLPKAA